MLICSMSVSASSCCSFARGRTGGPEAAPIRRRQKRRELKPRGRWRPLAPEGGIHLVQVGATPGSLGGRKSQRGGVTARAAGCGGATVPAPELDHQLPVGDRLGDGGLFEEPVEEHPARPGSPA